MGIYCNVLTLNPTLLRGYALRGIFPFRGSRSSDLSLKKKLVKISPPRKKKLINFVIKKERNHSLLAAR